MTDTNNNNGFPKALEGIVVLDLTRVLAGPISTMWLASMGATVIKIENPLDGGDVTRTYWPIFNGQSAVFSCLNRNKKGISLNLKDPEGKRMFFELAKKADVVIENFKPGVMDKLGVGYEALHAVNERLIYASISGFGTYGPYYDRPGYDIVGQGYSGIMSLTGEEDGPPMQVGPGIGDVSGGMNALIGVLAALRCRNITGKGQKVESSLVDSLVAFMTTDLERVLYSDQEVTRYGNKSRVGAPVGSYEAKDGMYIIGCATDEQFFAFAEKVLEKPELCRDERFNSPLNRVKNKPVMDEFIDAWGKALTVKEAVAQLVEAGIPGAPVNTLKDVVEDEHIAVDREMFLTLDQPGIGPFTVANVPIRFSESGYMQPVPAPGLGADNEEIYAEYLGIDKEKLAELRENKVI